MLATLSIKYDTVEDATEIRQVVDVKEYVRLLRDLDEALNAATRCGDGGEFFDADLCPEPDRVTLMGVREWLSRERHWRGLIFGEEQEGGG